MSHAGAVPGSTGNVSSNGLELLISPLDGDCELRQLNMIETNVVTCIAGYIHRQLLHKISCIHCAAALSNNIVMDKSTQLISLRDFGGLSYPSKGLLEVCKVTEQTLRAYNTVQLVQSKVLQHIVLSEVNTFFPDEHFHEPFSYSHLCSLIKLICHCYFTVRKDHQVKLFNMKKQASSVRKAFTKAVHFRGE